MSSEFTPSPAEVALTAKIFEKADPNKLGIITGDAAVNVFSGSKLPPVTLGEIWALADKENNGFLTRKGVAIALRLIGHAQRGEHISESLLSKASLPPTIDGYVSPILQQDTGSSVNRAKSPALSVPPTLTPQDKTKFMKIFLSCNPVNGMLSGDKAREVFFKSKLPVDKLSQIWNLADTRKRGSLDSVDFTIAMYLIQACMSGQIPFVPTSLPPGLYEQASSKALDGIVAHSTGNSSIAGPGLTGSFTSRVPSGSIQPQYTGSQSLQPQTTGASRFTAGPPTLPSRPVAQSPPNLLTQPQSTGLASQWDVTPAEKANADKFFDQLDESKRGFIEGDIAVPFMLQSKLSEDILAQIWDLADLHNDGRLTRDGFAVAMHLTQKKLTGKDIPDTLPPSLIPPSLRGTHTTPAAPQQSIQESLQDLLWDDPPSTTSPPPQPLQPQRTGPLQSQPQVLHPQRTGPLSMQTTGGRLPESVPQYFSPPNQGSFGGPQLSETRDLLEDDEDTGTNQLHDRSAEIGNAQNHLSSTNRALETVKTERADVDQKLADQAAQLSSLQTQLTSAKTAYEAETRLLETLRDRYANQNAEIKKLREDLITAESDVSALRAEKSEVQGNLLRDRDDVRDLQKKMASAGAEIETLRVDIEKLRKDAKQQKGLLAIAKKQLAAREAEKAKVESELQDAQMELKDISKEHEESEADLAKEIQTNLTNGHDIQEPLSLDNLSVSPAHSLPPARGSAPSPPASVRSASTKSTNPFDRLTFVGTPRSESPFLAFASSPTVSTMPSQSIPSSSSTDDPFGFPTDFVQTEEPETLLSEVVPSETGDVAASTPKLGFLANDAAGTGLSMLDGLKMSPGSDSEEQFSTPPSMATGQSNPDSPTFYLPASSTSSYLALNAAAVNFPDLAAADPPGLSTQNTETDLNSAVKELEVEDTDSSDEEVMEPKLTSQPIPAENARTLQSATSAFDDMFDISSESPQPTASTAPTRNTSLPEQIPTKDPAPAPFDSFEPPSSTEVAFSSDEIAPTSNGVVSDSVTGKSAFDEAMSTIPADHSAATKDATFDFDSAFDDNFDFAAAKAQAEKPFSSPSRSPITKDIISTFPAPPQSGQIDSVFGTAGTNPSASPPTMFATNKGMSFDDAFGPGSSIVQSPSPALKPQDPLGISFTPAFGEQRASRALAFDDFPTPKNTPAQPPSPVTFPLSPSGTYSSLTGSNTRRTASPVPDLPPRQQSPKARSSTGFSDKSKEPPTRHSRLSIRLPFGRRKKTENPPPPVPRTSQLLPAAEDPVSDDDDTVKQLTSMGFGREDAVFALERNSYDFQRALNSLLGVQ